MIISTTSLPFKKITISCFLIASSVMSLFAASLSFDAPSTVSSNRAPFSITVFLDPEKEKVSGVAGDFSFPTLLFDLGEIRTQGSIISLWATEPQISKEKYVDNHTHISFEGVILGGFSGVLSPYYEGGRKGALFTVTLIPKNQGKGILLLDSVEVRAFDDNATLLSTLAYSFPVTVPTLSGKVHSESNEYKQVDNASISLLVQSSDLVNNGLKYLFVNDSDSSHVIDHIEVVETKEYDTNNLSSYEWHKVTNPYTLLFQARDVYVHVKVFYSDNTFAIKTISPVENSHMFSDISRILIGILIAVVLLYYYGHKNQISFTKFFKSHKSS